MQREGTGVFLPTAKYESMTTDLVKLKEIEALLQASRPPLAFLQLNLPNSLAPTLVSPCRSLSRFASLCRCPPPPPPLDIPQRWISRAELEE